MSESYILAEHIFKPGYEGIFCMESEKELFQ